MFWMFADYPMCSPCFSKHVQNSYLDTFGSHDKVHSKGNQYLACNYMQFTLYNVFWMCSQCTQLGTLGTNFGDHSKCTQFCNHWVHWGHMDINIQNVFNIWPSGALGSHGWAHSKCVQHLITGHIGDTCCLCSQCVQHVPTGYFGPCPQCHSESGHRLICCFLCKSDQHVSAVYILIKVVNMF